MREIKFRGKSLKTNKWVYGYYMVNSFEEHLICNDKKTESVDPETVGQYINWKDEKGAEIYEGDIVERDSGSVVTRGSVLYQRSTFWLAVGGWDVLAGGSVTGHPCTIIGNIHENSDLLEESNKV